MLWKAAVKPFLHLQDGTKDVGGIPLYKRQL